VLDIHDEPTIAAAQPSLYLKADDDVVPLVEDDQVDFGGALWGSGCLESSSK
jgi:hypothetical protein